MKKRENRTSAAQKELGYPVWSADPPRRRAHLKHVSVLRKTLWWIAFAKSWICIAPLPGECILADE
jgi:hypothetical protein